MNLVKGELFESGANVIVVSTNSFVKTNGALVMGRGAALELSRREPKIPFLAGQQILRVCGHMGTYGFMVINGFSHYGIFQVKRNWSDKASVGLIETSAYRLSLFANHHLRMDKGFKIAMNFPGIGNGHLTRDVVLPRLKDLPNNVYVHEQKMNCEGKEGGQRLDS